MPKSAFAFLVCAVLVASVNAADARKQPHSRVAFDFQFSPGVPDDWNGGPGFWSSAGNWNNGIPGSNSDVTIYSGGGDDIVLLDVSSTINSLSIGGASNGFVSQLTDNGFAQTLTISNALNVGQQGALFLYGGSTVAVGTDVTNNAGGFIDFDGGSTVTIGGNVSNSSGGGPLQGMFTGFFGTGGNLLIIAGTMINNANGTFILFGPGDTASIGNGMSNSGFVEVANSSTLTITGNVTNFNSGFIDVEGGSTLTINGDVTSSAGLFTSSALSGGNRLNITGTLTSTAGGQIVPFGPGDVVTLGSLINSSFADVEGGSTLQVIGDASNDQALFTSYYGSGGNKLNVGGTLTNLPGGLFILYGPGDVATLGSLTNFEFVDVEGQSTLQVNGDVNNFNGLFTSAAGTGGNTLNINGTLTNNPGGQLVLFGPGDKATLGNLINSSFADVERGSKLQIKGNVSNFGGMFTSFYGGGGNTLNIGGALTNNGNFELFGPGDTANIGGGVFSSVEMNVDGGSRLDIAGNMDNAGLFTTSGFLLGGGNIVNLGGTLTNEATGAFFLYGGGDVVSVARGMFNSGSVDLEGGSTLHITGDLTNDGLIRTNLRSFGGGNTLTVTGRLSNSGIVRLNGPGDVLHANGGLVNNGFVTVNNGSMIDPPFLNNIGIVNIDSTSTFVVGTGAALGQGYIQLANGTLGEMISNSNFGQIFVNGSVSLDGTLDILLQGGFKPAVGSAYDLILFTPGDLTGTFSNIQNDIFNNGTEMWLLTYDNSGGLVELTAEARAVPEPGSLLMLFSGVVAAGYELRRKLLKGAGHHNL
jgi:hypothetical protein